MSGIMRGIAMRIYCLFSDVPWYVCVDSSRLSRDPAIVAAHRSDKLCSGFVYFRSLLGPLLAGHDVLDCDYARWPTSLPLLLAHGEKDGIMDPKATVELGEKLVADDKVVKIWQGCYHELHNEVGDEKASARSKKTCP